MAYFSELPHVLVGEDATVSVKLQLTSGEVLGLNTSVPARSGAFMEQGILMGTGAELCWQ